MADDKSSFWANLFDFSADNHPAKAIDTPISKTLNSLPKTVQAPPIPRYLQGDFIQQIWNTEANGVGDMQTRNAALGDHGKAKGQFQMHSDYVITANNILQKKRRIEAQTWAKTYAPNWQSDPIDSQKYNQKLASIPEPKLFKDSDRTDYTKQIELYRTMMEWSVANFVRQNGKTPTDMELAQLHNAGGHMPNYGTPSNNAYGLKFLTMKPKQP